MLKFNFLILDYSNDDEDDNDEDEEDDYDELDNEIEELEDEINNLEQTLNWWGGDTSVLTYLKLNDDN